MILHYLRHSYRNLCANKLIFGGSVITLFLGVTCVVLLLNFVVNEFTMNEFHKNSENIYLVQSQLTPDSKPEAAMLPTSEINAITKKYPEIENVVSIQCDNLHFIINDLELWEKGFVVSDNFFEVFNFDLLSGNKQTSLKNKDNILLTERFSKKLFGDKNPIGEIIGIDSRLVESNERYEYKVVGILKNPPSNSSMNFDFIVPQNFNRFLLSGVDFLLMNKNFNKKDFESKIENLLQAPNNVRTKESKLSLFPLNKVYFSDSPVESSWSNPIFSHYGNRKSVNIFLIVIAIILIMSALNFSNFQAIMVNASLKNVGLIKMFGAGNRIVFLQKLCEIFIISIITSAFVLLACYWGLPFFNSLIDTELRPNLIFIFFESFAIIIILSTLSNVYPMLVNSRLPIVFGLRKSIIQSKSISEKKAVVAIQFIMTFILLISTIIAVKQLNMMLNKDVGFNTKDIIVTNFIFGNNMDRETLQENQQYIKNELDRVPSITSFSQGNTLFDSYTRGGWKKFGDSDDFKDLRQLMILPESFKIFDLKLTEGRFFMGSDDDYYSVVINEAAKKYFGFQDIGDAKLAKDGFHPKYGGTLKVVGVVKDFNFGHLSKTPQPLVIQVGGAYDGSFIIKYKHGAEQETLAAIKTIFNKFNPEKPVEYKFISDYIAAMYIKDRKLVENYTIFTVIALLISTIGLFTIALYDTRRRVKEIGIRKVNGARISEILVLLNTDLVKWVTISFIIACPIAYYAMYKWLQSYAYKTELSWWIFILAGVLVLSVALLTVSWQSYRAATRNPVEALRYE